MTPSLGWMLLLACGSALQEPATKRSDPAPSPADPTRKLKTTRLTSAAELRGEHTLAWGPQLRADGRFMACTVVNTLPVGGPGDHVDKLLLGDLTKASFRMLAQRPSSTSRQPLGAVSISRAGEVIAFTDYSTQQIFVGSRDASEFTPLQLPKAAAGAETGARYPWVSADGKSIVFPSEAPNLVPEDTNRSSDVFLVVLDGGAIECISVTPAGKPGNGTSFAREQSSSHDGNEVLFFSNATDLVEGSAKYRPNLFLRNRRERRTTRIAQGPMIPDQADVGAAQYSQTDGVVAMEVTSRTPLPFFGRATIVLQWMDGSRSVDLREWIQQVEPGLKVGACMDPRFAFGGRYFVCIAAVGPPAKDGTPFPDNSTLGPYAPVLVDLKEMKLRLLRVGVGGEFADMPSFEPCVSDDGSVICFASGASNLVAGDASKAGRDIYKVVIE